MEVRLAVGCEAALFNWSLLWKETGEHGSLRSHLYNGGEETHTCTYARIHERRWRDDTGWLAINYHWWSDAVRWTYWIWVTCGCTGRDSVFKQDDAFPLCKGIFAAYNYHIYKTELLNNQMVDLYMWLFGLQRCTETKTSIYCKIMFYELSLHGILALLVLIKIRKVSI